MIDSELATPAAQNASRSVISSLRVTPARKRTVRSHPQHALSINALRFSIIEQHFAFVWLNRQKPVQESARLPTSLARYKC